jgi:hypothetical protein
MEVSSQWSCFNAMMDEIHNNLKKGEDKTYLQVVCWFGVQMRMEPFIIMKYEHNCDYLKKFGQKYLNKGWQDG